MWACQVSQSSGFWNTQGSGEGGRTKGLRCRGVGNAFSFGYSAHFMCGHQTTTLTCFYLKQVEKALKQETERLDHGLLLGDHLIAGRGYLPGHRPSAWGHAAFRDTLSHTRLASYQGTGLYVWHPLGYCNTA